MLGVALVLTTFTVARCYVDSALWLDEALSVSIAQLPLSELRDALRVDGSPPLYYALLHVWIRFFGDGDQQVRLLSAVFGVLSLPLAWAVGTRLRDRTTGWCAVLLLAASPFAVHYATEARMYSLVVLEVLLLGLTVLRALDTPSVPRLLPVPVIAALLLYTHYWSLFLLAALGLVLLAHSVRGAAAPSFRRVSVALAFGLLLFVPWLPTFLYQVRHTGTPWAKPPGTEAVLLTVREWAGGATASGELLFVVLLGLIAVGLFGRAARGPDDRAALTVHLPVEPTARALLGVALGTLVLGIGTGMALQSGYAYRYSSVAVVPALLLAALGLATLAPRARVLVLVLVVATAATGVARLQLFTPRTQAATVAAELRARLLPGDLVLYCPDQLGPAVSRLLPAGVDQAVYPSFGHPERIDWRDYEARNAAADPVAFGAAAASRAKGAVYLVWQSGYRTFGTQCQQLAGELTQARGSREQLLMPEQKYAERHHLDRFPATGAASR